MKVVLVHGMFVSDGGRSTVGRLVKPLEYLGYEVEQVMIGFWSLFRMYFGSKWQVTQNLVKSFWDADVIITHSMGAMMTERALRVLPVADRKRLLFHFGPSLNKNKRVPHAISWRWVFHSERDVVVKSSGWLPFLMLGRMGQKGADKMPRNTNINRTLQVGRQHSDGYFGGPNAKRYAERVHTLITTYRETP